MKSVTDSNQTSAIPPLKHNGRIYNKARDKTELLNKIFASNAQLDDDGKRPPNLHSKTSAVLSIVKVRPKKVLKKLRNA